MLRPGSFALTVLLALLTALGPLSTDMYLPSLPAIGTALGAETATVQLTLSVFLLGFASGQIVYGPLSDRLGRKPVLMAGLVIYTLASVGCALSPTIPALIALRFVQALGASGPIVLARAIARDLFEGEAAARQLALMASIMALVPAAAPFFGGFMQVSIGWQANFVFAALFGLAAIVWVWFGLPETLKKRNETRFSLMAILGDFRALARHGTLLTWLALIAVTYTGIFAFISGSSFVLQGQMGLGEMIYGLCFGICSLAYAGGTILARRWIGPLGRDRVIGIGTVAMAVAGVAMAAGYGLFPTSAAAIVAPMMLYMAGVGLVFPFSTAAALMPFPHMAGAASSLQGLTQMCFAALVGALIGLGIGSSAWPLAGTMAALGLAALGLFVRVSRRTGG